MTEQQVKLTSVTFVLIICKIEKMDKISVKFWPILAAHGE